MKAMTTALPQADRDARTGSGVVAGRSSPPYGPQARASLREAERQDWQSQWADVEELAAQAGGKSFRQAK
jgi:hypothetical protein